MLGSILTKLEVIFMFAVCEYILPEVQLSVFVQLIQILLGYMRPIVSENRVSN
jgi:hypothetical protein